jgi:acetyl esterase/lipase
MNSLLNQSYLTETTVSVRSLAVRQKIASYAQGVSCMATLDVTTTVHNHRLEMPAHDYSRFGQPTEQWLAIQDTLPKAASISTKEDAAAFRITVNRGRDQAAALAMKTLGPKVAVADFSITTRDGRTLPVRTYRAKVIPASKSLPMYLHLHGGGFLFGTLDSEDATCARMASNAQILVVNLCYSHTPEYAYPVAWNDVEDAIDWLDSYAETIYGQRERVIVGGISAGAWLAASLLLQSTNGSGVRIIGQVLMIPCLVHPSCYGPQLGKLPDPRNSSYEQNQNAPILPLKRAKDFADLLDIGVPREDDIRLNPGNATAAQMQHLPPTVFGIAGLDILRDEGLHFAEMLHTSG